MKRLLIELGFTIRLHESRKHLKRMRLCMAEISANFPSILSLYPFWQRRSVVKSIAETALHPTDLIEYEDYINYIDQGNLLETLDFILMAEKFENFVCKKISLSHSNQRLRLYFEASKIKPVPLPLNEAVKSLKALSNPEVQDRFFDLCQQCLEKDPREEEPPCTGEWLLSQFRAESATLWDSVLKRIKLCVEQNNYVLLAVMEKAMEKRSVTVVEYLKKKIMPAVVYKHFRLRCRLSMLSGYYSAAELAMDSWDVIPSQKESVIPPPMPKTVFSVQDTRRCPKAAYLPAE